MQSGEIFMLSELSQELANRTIRITGQVRALDVHSKMCTLFHKEHSLVVDASLVDIALLAGESVCQIIGELRLGSERFQGASAPPLYLRASVVRVVNDLDVDLFEQSVLLRRKFLQDTVR